MALFQTHAEMWDSLELQARRLGINVELTSEATEMLEAMGYRVTRRPVEMWLDAENMQRVFRITHEVYEWVVTDVPAGHTPTCIVPTMTRNIIRTETREVTIRDDLSASSDTIDYSQG